MAKTDRGSHEEETEFREYRRWQAHRNKQVQGLTPYIPPSQHAIPPLEDVLPTIAPVYRELAEAASKEEYNPTKS
jgi:hypothetical protein